MKSYSKPALSFQEQAQLLIDRGLVATEDALVAKLRVVNYYRLSAYWLPFKQSDDSIIPGTTLETIWARYVFDRQLRLIVMDAIERIEIAVRTLMANKFTLRYGAFGHLNSRNFNESFKSESHAAFISRLTTETKRSREIFVAHYKKKYDPRDYFPLWMAVETMSFGNMLTLFRNLDMHLKREMANTFGVSGKILESWLKTLNYIRNICAHHSRLWNRVLAIKPLLPTKNPCWHEPVRITNEQIFSVLTLLRYMLNFVAPQSQWKQRLCGLIEKYPEIPIKEMGFPDNWWACPIWQDQT